jgi:hypothetical protein
MLPLLGVNVTGEHGYRLAIGRVVGHCTLKNFEVAGAFSAVASRRKTLSRETFVTYVVARWTHLPNSREAPQLAIVSP